MKKPIISFLIVNWNGGEVLKKCLLSIEESCEQINLKDYEIIVIDNNSNDVDEKFFKNKNKIKFFKNKRNELFAKATNQSVAYSKGNLIFIMNNDVILIKDCLKVLLNEIKIDKNIDIVVPQLLKNDGRIQKDSIVGIPTLLDLFYISIGLNFLHPVFDRWINRNFNFNKKQIINGQAAFSALLMKRSTWEKVGDIDENFPLLWNDMDWFFRFQNNRGKCVFVPQAKALHKHGMSVNKNRYKKIWISSKSMYYFFVKNYQLTGIKKILLIIICIYTTFFRFIIESINIVKIKLKNK